MTDGPDVATRVRERVERLARAQCTVGEIAATIWAEGLANREEARILVRDFGDDVVAWKLAGRAEVRVAAHDGAVGMEKLSPGQAAAQAAWAKQHLGWDKQGMNDGKQTQAEQREGAAAQKLKAV